MHIFRRRKQGRPVLLAVVADTHPNSKLGLCAPSPIDRGDGDQYIPTKTQRWLYGCWTDFWNREVPAAVAEYDCEAVIGLHVGDGVDRNIKSQVQLIAPFRQSLAVDIAANALQLGRDACDYWFMIRGTDVHVGPDGDAEEQVAEKLGAVKDEARNRWTWDYLKLYAAGVLVGAAHHPRTFSGRPWTRGAAANRQAVILRDEYAVYDELDELPRLTLFAHRHTFEDSGYTHLLRQDGRYIGTRTVYCPAWQAHTAHVRRIGHDGDARPCIGGLLFVCFTNGDYIMRPPVRYFMERRKAWRRPTT